MLVTFTDKGVKNPKLTRGGKTRALGWLLIGSLLLLIVSLSGTELTAPGQDQSPIVQAIIVRDPSATSAFSPRPEKIRLMVERGITCLTGKSNALSAWRGLVSTNDIVGIKVWSGPGRISGTRPEVVAAVVEGLIASGLPASHIVVWDKHYEDLSAAGFLNLKSLYGIEVEASARAGYDTNTFYEAPLLGSLVYGDFEFGQKGEGIGRKSYVSKLVTTKLTKIIQVTPLFNHTYAGVYGNLFSLATGSVDNTLRFEYEAHRLAEAVPEIYALPVLGDRVVLNIVDALFCQYEGGGTALLHYSTVLNELRFSTDPVALDLLSIEELDRNRRNAGVIPLKRNVELYRNASLLEIGISDLSRIEVVHVP